MAEISPGHDPSACPLCPATPGRLRAAAADVRWILLACLHVAEMMEAGSRSDCPKAVTIHHARLDVIGVDVAMQIGPEGQRGLSPADWQRVGDALVLGYGRGEFVTLTSLGVFRVAE